jgi:hypothetical protein
MTTEKLKGVTVVGKMDLPEKTKPANVKKFERAKAVAKALKPTSTDTPKKRQPRPKNTIGLITELGSKDVIKEVTLVKSKGISKTTLKLMEKHGCKTIEEYRLKRKQNKSLRNKK